MIRRIVDSPIVGDTFRLTINNNLKCIFCGRGKKKNEKKKYDVSGVCVTGV